VAKLGQRQLEKVAFRLALGSRVKFAGRKITTYVDTTDFFSCLATRWPPRLWCGNKTIGEDFASRPEARKPIFLSHERSVIVINHGVPDAPDWSHCFYGSLSLCAIRLLSSPSRHRAAQSLQAPRPGPFLGLDRACAFVLLHPSIRQQRPRSAYFPCLRRVHCQFGRRQARCQRWGCPRTIGGVRPPP